MSTVTITDERPAARQKTSFQMDFLEDRLTAREFLRPDQPDRLRCTYKRPSQFRRKDSMPGLAAGW